MLKPGSRTVAVAVALILVLLAGTAWPLNLDNVSILGTIFNWNKYRTKEQAAAVQASFNRDKRYIREGEKNIKVVFNPAVSRIGAVGFNIRPMRADQAIFFSLYSNGCGTLVKVRLWEGDGGFWESKTLSLNFAGWKEFLLEETSLEFYPNSNGKQAWTEIKHIQIILEGSPCTIYADELNFVPRPASSLDRQR